MKKRILSTDKHRWRQINQVKSNRKSWTKSTSYLCLSGFIGGLFVFFLIASAVWLNPDSSPKVSAAETVGEMESVLYTRQEFFGAEAIVPLPTNEARENLTKIADAQTENPLILEKVAELDERLEKYNEAEKNLIRLSEIDAAKNDTLAAFYNRRAEFGKEAEVLRKALFTTDMSNRAAVFERLIETARIHELPAYLNADFYAEVAKENPSAYRIFEGLTDTLVEEKNYAEALKFVRQAKAQFPERQSVLLAKEIEIFGQLRAHRQGIASL